MAVAVVATTRSSAWPRPLGLLKRREFLRSAALFVLGGVFVVLLRKARETYQRIRRARAESLWRRYVDFSVVQACVLSTEHLHDLGRIEKRTLFVKPITEVFRNEYILARVLEAAENAAASKDPMLVTQLSEEDKWHVLNTCTNHISSLFAPYHVFFNEARRTKSYFKSAWYCFTLTCAQTEAEGRWFITPFRPVGTGDCGILRIRIVLVNEKELREIAAGDIEEPSEGTCNGRHESRWEICQRFASLFGRQLQQVTGSVSSYQDWGKNLCGRISRKKRQWSGGNRLASAAATAAMDIGAGGEYEPCPEDNAILRIHLPFPTSSGRGQKKEGQGTMVKGANMGVPLTGPQVFERTMSDDGENVSKDVVLFE